MKLFSDTFANNHFLSKMDARVKLCSAAILLAMMLSCRGFALPLILSCFCILICVSMEIPAGVLCMRFFGPTVIAMVVLALKFLFTGSDTAFSLHLFGLRVSGQWDGLREGLVIVSRVIGSVSLVSVMGFSTPFAEFASALSWAKAPKGFVEILLFAYRFIFVLLDDAGVIYNAQKNRLGYSSMKRGLQSFGTLAGSLVLKAFSHSQNLTSAMVHRGYNGTVPETRLRPLEFSETVAPALVIIVFGTLWKM